MPPIHETFDWPQVSFLDPEGIICAGRSSNASQFWGTVDTLQRKKCAFCHRDHLDGRVVIEGEHCFAFTPTVTFSRHSGKLAYKIVVPYRHHGSDSGLIPAAHIGEMWEVLHAARKELRVENPDGGGIYLRHGSALYNGATVPHHVHLNDDGPNGLGEVRPPFYKKKEGWEKDLRRFREFFSVYTRGMSRENYLAAYAEKIDR